jgi:hypothetical protein
VDPHSDTADTALLALPSRDRAQSPDPTLHVHTDDRRSRHHRRIGLSGALAARAAGNINVVLGQASSALGCPMVSSWMMRPSGSETSIYRPTCPSAAEVWFVPGGVEARAPVVEVDGIADTERDQAEAFERACEFRSGVQAEGESAHEQRDGTRAVAADRARDPKHCAAEWVDLVSGPWVNREHVIVVVVEADRSEAVDRFIVESRLMQWNRIRILPSLPMEDGMKDVQDSKPLF